jgi:Ca2+:H+ antiporter
MSNFSRLERFALVAVSAATALAGLAHYAHWTAVLAFALATLSLAGLAWIVAIATEQVGERLGPAATGLLQSSVGNLPELFVVIFALRAGELVVAQSAIVGSLFANALLVLGIVLVTGAARRGAGGVMRFDPRLARDTATLLFICLFIIVLVGISLSAGGSVAHHTGTISVIAAVALLLAVYLAWIIPHVRGDSERPPTAAPRIGLARGDGTARGRRWRLGLRLRLVRRRARAGDHPAAYLAGFRRARDRRDRGQRR